MCWLLQLGCGARHFGRHQVIPKPTLDTKMSNKIQALHAPAAQDDMSRNRKENVGAALKMAGRMVAKVAGHLDLPDARTPMLYDRAGNIMFWSKSPWHLNLLART